MKESLVLVTKEITHSKQAGYLKDRFYRGEILNLLPPQESLPATLHRPAWVLWMEAAGAAGTFPSLLWRKR